MITPNKGLVEDHCGTVCGVPVVYPEKIPISVLSSFVSKIIGTEVNTIKKNNRHNKFDKIRLLLNSLTRNAEIRLLPIYLDAFIK